MRLDLEDFDSIKSFAAEIVKSEPNIDFLINNAGLFLYLFTQLETVSTHFTKSLQKINLVSTFYAVYNVSKTKINIFLNSFLSSFVTIYRIYEKINF